MINLIGRWRSYRLGRAMGLSRRWALWMARRPGEWHRVGER